MAANTKEKKLSIRERLLISGIVKGETIAQAARDAGYKESYIKSQIYSKGIGKARVRRAIEDIMEEKGLTDERLIDKLLEGLEAYKSISCIVYNNPPPKDKGAKDNNLKDADSKTHDFVDVPDYPTQHKFLDTALKLKGSYPTEKKAVKADINVNQKDKVTGVIAFPTLSANEKSNS